MGELHSGIIYLIEMNNKIHEKVIKGVLFGKQ